MEQVKNNHVFLFLKCQNVAGQFLRIYYSDSERISMVECKTKGLFLTFK